MLFKQALKTIAGVTLPNHNLRTELKHIEKVQNGFFSNMPYEEYEQWRKLTINTYIQITAVKEALENAKANTGQYLWLQAYDLAHKADTSIKKLLEYKLYKFLYPANNSISLLFHMWMLVIVITMLSKFIRQNYGLTQDQLENLVVFFILVSQLPQIVRIIMIMSITIARRHEIFIESDWCSNILEEAKKIGINIDLKTISKSQPWSNEQLLEDIGCKNIPEEFDCIISCSVMTKPVYSTSNKARFEKTVIDSWLFKKNQHPLTYEELYWDDLILDKELELKIGNFTHNKTREFICHTIMPSILERIEMEAEEELSTQFNPQFRMK